MKGTNWQYLGRELALLLGFAYVFLLGGGFAALVDFQFQLASTLLVIAVLGSWLAWRLLNRARLPATGIDLALLFFLLSQFIAVIFSEDPRRSLPHTITWLVYMIILYFFLDLLRRGWPAELFEKCALIAGTIVIGFGLIELSSLYFSWQAIVAGLEFGPGFEQRITSVLGDPNLLAAFTNLLIPLAIGKALISGRSARILLAIFVLAAILVLFFTDSRGGQLAFFTALASLAILWVVVVSDSAQKQARKAWKAAVKQKWLLPSAGAVATLTVILLAGRLVGFEGDTTHAPILTARNIYWQAAANAVAKDPFTGSGPGLYPISLMQIWSTPPARPYLHAHSLPFQVVAESGLLGLAAFAFLAFAVSRRAWGALRGLNFEGRARWAAAAAALLGLAVHSLVDDFFQFPAVGILAMLLIAIVLSPAYGKEKSKGVSPLWLAVPGLLIALFSVGTLLAHWHADRSVEFAESPNWETAADDVAAAAMADPGIAHYWFQAGYANSQLAEQGSTYLAHGISYFETGLELEPQYALNHANLAALYWESGQQEQAVAQMRIATRLAPEAWLFWLNQGAYEEDLGEVDHAQASYTNAIKFHAATKDATFWNETELRQTVMVGYVEPTEPTTKRERLLALVTSAHELITTGDLVAARAALVQAHELSEQEVLVYVAFGELAFAEGDLTLAESYVQAALWVQVTSNRPKVEAILLGAEIASARGDAALALQRYEAAYRSILANSSYGWGSAGWSPYAWFVFQRRAFPEDLVPQLLRADIPQQIAARLLPLVDLYEQAGMQIEAEDVLAALDPYLPQD